MDIRNCLRYAFRIIGISILLLSLQGNGAIAATITVPTDYANIQWAIDNATTGDTIEVHSGTYHENVNVNKRLILQGIGVPVVTVETGSAITLAADGITLEAFTATGAGTSMNNGITVTSNNNTLIGNNASNNGDSGISLIGGGNCESYGIGLYSSNNNTLSGNNANGNYGYDASCGIYLYSSSNNMLFGNNVHWNGGHFPGYGIYLEFSNNNTLTNNNADSNSGYYGGYGISLSLSSNNTLNYNNANSNGGSSGGYGISLESSNSNILIGNNASYNNAGGGAFGIFLSSSGNNTLVGNNASNNGEGYYDGYPYGIYLYSSSNNLIYNNIFNNINNIGLYNSNINNWNITKQSGTNIIGGSYISGNFWADPDGSGFSQTCTDADKDWICDQPYVLDGNNIDHFPLSYKPPSISFTNPTPANGATLSQNYAFINMTVSNISTAFIDWNRSLIGWWRFNGESGENSTFFRDWSSWRNNAGCSGINCPTSTPGKFGNALNFDGSNDYIIVPNSAILNPSNITLETWFNANSGGLAGQKPLIQKPYTSHAAPYYQYMLSLMDTVGYPKAAEFYLTINGVMQDVEIKNLGYNYGQWHYLAGTYDGSTMTMYLDGNIVGTKPIVGTITSYNTILEFGAYPNVAKSSSNVFKGKLDEARIHSRALSPEEIKASYNAGIYRLYNNFTNLPAGVYNHRAFGQDLSGNVNPTETRSLTIVSNQPSMLIVSILESPDPVISNGTSQVTVHVTSGGSNVAGANVGLSITGGSLSSSTGATDAAGNFTVTYTAPSVTTSTTHTISSTASKTGFVSGSGSDLITVNPVSSGLRITNIVAASGKTYVNDTLAIGKLFYIDRTYKFTGVPPSYTGLNYIKTATDDRYRTESNFLQFDVNKDVTAYVAYDDRISPKPSWLTSFFTDTGDNVVRDDSSTFSIYSRNYPAGHISLGGTKIPSGGAGGSYVVILKPQGPPLPSPLIVSISESPDPVISNGTSQVTVHVTSGGSNVAGANVGLSITGGSLSSSTGATDASGNFTVTYTAPSVTASTTHTISSTASKTGFVSGSGSDLITVNPVSSGLRITNIVAASGKKYVNDTLAIGKLFYIDRTYKFTGVPPSYTGLNYIKTSTDDRYRTESNFLQFDVNKDVTVYVAYDDRVSPKPSWLTSFFTDTGDNVVRDDSSTFSIYSRNYPAGHISLGGTKIPSGGAGGSYVVILKPQGPPLPSPRIVSI